jgi:hypothetical protein
VSFSFCFVYTKGLKKLRLLYSFYGENTRA